MFFINSTQHLNLLKGHFTNFKPIKPVFFKPPIVIQQQAHPYQVNQLLFIKKPNLPYF